ncbi:MAG: fibrobacter succinogenes major paralogous domain-containing protein [Fibromonadaceae bacterium]|nr:fibrobacter succinogenes major paralogous domain-containing protein [Fibromonadaceae bacterium]
MHLSPLFVLLLFAFVAYGQEEQKRLAILNTEDNGEQELEYTDLLYLTDRLREIAVKMLPEDKYFVMTTQSIIDKMGSKENARKMCKEATCMAEIGRKISAEYIGQARLGRFGGNLTISMELYHSARGNLLGSFTGRAKDVFGLEAIINENAPQLFAKMSGTKASPVSVPASVPAPAPIASAASSFKDSRDNNTYKIVKIGNQTWMAENLNYNASGSKCYNNSESYCQKYGRLYDWNTAKTACPRGWHLPSKDEYGKLDDFVGGTNTAGKFLKAASGWNNNGNGNDKFGFSALPGGYGSSDGGFHHVDNYGYWWSSSEYGRYSAYRRDMGYREGVYYIGNIGMSILQSVRCLQD